MSQTRRLTRFQLTGMEPRGGGVTFALETDEGQRDSFSASHDVFGGLVRFLLEVDDALRARRSGAQQQAAEPDLIFPKEVDLLIDVTGAVALLRMRTGHGRTIQLELSEELLARLQRRIPEVLAGLRSRPAAGH